MPKTIAIDAMTLESGMGPLEEAVKTSSEEYPCLRMLLVGDEEDTSFSSVFSRYPIEHAPEKIEPHDDLKAILRKKSSSTYRTAELVGSGEADAGISFGNTKGVAIAVARNLKPLNGLKKIPLAVKIPAVREKDLGYFTLLDVGSTGMDDCTPRNLLEFGILASHYEIQHSISCPLLGLLSNGSEKRKGTRMLREADDLFLQYSKVSDLFSYCGFVEGRDIFYGNSQSPDIVVADGFSGNICLKMMEGEALLFRHGLKKAFSLGILAKLSAAIADYAGVFTDLKQIIHPDEYGGAAFLGLKHPFIKGHGASSSKAVRATIRSAYESLSCSSDKDLLEHLEKIDYIAE